MEIQIIQIRNWIIIYTGILSAGLDMDEKEWKRLVFRDSNDKGDNYYENGLKAIGFIPLIGYCSACTA